MGSLRRNNGNRHGRNHVAGGVDHPCNRGADLLHRRIICLFYSFQLHSALADGSNLRRIRHSCGFLGCGVADQQESGYVWQPIGDVGTLCIDIRIKPGNRPWCNITKEKAICVSYGLFTDKHIQPSPNEINEALGTVQAEWTSLGDFVHSHYRTQEDFKFLYGRDYGWALRFRHKGKLLTALFPNRDHFTCLVILNWEQLGLVENIKFHSSTRKAIDSANLYAEGKWLFVKVGALNDVKDVGTIVDLKAQKSTAGVQSTRKKRSG